MKKLKVSQMVYLRPEQDEALERISAQTGMSINELIREGVNEVIAKRQRPAQIETIISE